MSETAGPNPFGRVEDAQTFGRVEDDGTVYVITPEGERRVGQVPDVDPSEALAFYVRRFQSLETEVGLLEARIASGTLGVEEARKSIDSHRKNIVDANAVGDLASLVARLDALAPTLEAQQEQRKAEKAKAAQAAKAEKERMVAEAEKLAQGNDWRGGVNRFRALLEEWKALPRIDRATDDALWHRFSSARTTYTRRRKAQFAEQNKKREGARQLKEQIIEEARPLASSTQWGPTAGAFRDLMARWKAAGSAPRAEDDKLWATFRAIQDEFFAARDAAMAEQDKEFVGNQQAKEALLDEAEKTILPVTDLATARTQFRDFLSKFNEYGKVPRDAIRPLDARVRKLENAVKDAEAEEWRRTDPEARQRAADTVAMFTAQIEKLTVQAEKLEAEGKEKKAKEARDSIAFNQSLLDQAQKALDEFKS
ncbi:DUF349 domain-containing protein [Luteococcus sp. OSA5]|uniref:DUF349 domain-containing protein n=1 Tax=Luteococcus sp. OSA5 TaxID=3401630 RepID=UPI003B43A568